MNPILEGAMRLVLGLFSRQKASGDIEPHGWDSAPEWAQWRTVDADGSVVWHENQPWRGPASNQWVSDGRWLRAGDRDWTELVEGRK